ncbi:hypothetical protein MKW94_013752 [Papaver nudicaule]|uniref:NIF system FeS cluster assembly NifU N-terminal domain-containing protein n=1 Tax=Papaver nudicaule TaxID=74823 RepID=A0AA41SI35_PAPNU|nr:hypothetical protein [Papaver nudicaule]
MLYYVSMLTLLGGFLSCCSEIAKHLSLPPVKLHCSMLAEDAIKAAVKDYEAKRVKAGTSANVKEDGAAHA